MIRPTSAGLVSTLFDQLDQVVLIDPHTHIPPLAPAANNLADLLGYHYYTELAHSAGMPRELIEEVGLEPREKVRRLVEFMQPLENTIQYSWLIELAQRLFDFPEDRLTADNWEGLYETAQQKMSLPGWSDQVLQAARVEAVFLTNDFDDELEGFDTSRYIPCLRTDDLVFHLSQPEVRWRLGAATDIDVTGAGSLRHALSRLFDHFVGHQAKACAISLPPDFAPTPVDRIAADEAVHAVYTSSEEGAVHPQRIRELSHFVFWTLAELCAEYRLPFDLMIGVNRNVYPQGVHQGRDLFASGVSLLQYRELFNAFAQVTFPVSVLASVTNQELVAFSWIFPNVVTSGHWWYSNTPTYIRHDLSGRLGAVPQTKQIGYYSDAYKLEFVQPKFAMYKRILAQVLADDFVLARGWTETRALELGQQILRGNVQSIFGWQ